MPDFTLRRLSGSKFSQIIGCTDAFAAWDAVAAACAREWGCCDEDVSVEEADDGTEYLTVLGVRMGLLCPHLGPTACLPRTVAA